MRELAERDGGRAVPLRPWHKFAERHDRVLIPPGFDANSPNETTVAIPLWIRRELAERDEGFAIPLYIRRELAGRDEGLATPL